jgi:hypothetical protein
VEWISEQIAVSGAAEQRNPAMPADESRERDAAAEPLIRASVQQTRNQAGKAIFARAIAPP